MPVWPFNSSASFVLNGKPTKPSVSSSQTCNGVDATVSGNGFTIKSKVVLDVQLVMVLVSTATIACGLLVLAYKPVMAFTPISASV